LTVEPFLAYQNLGYPKQFRIAQSRGRKVLVNHASEARRKEKSTPESIPFHLGVGEVDDVPGVTGGALVGEA
jgi:hypothetical protein